MWDLNLNSLKLIIIYFTAVVGLKLAGQRIQDREIAAKHTAESSPSLSINAVSSQDSKDKLVKKDTDTLSLVKKDTDTLSDMDVLATLKDDFIDITDVKVTRILRKMAKEESRKKAEGNSDLRLSQIDKFIKEQLVSLDDTVMTLIKRTVTMTDRGKLLLEELRKELKPNALKLQHDLSIMARVVIKISEEIKTQLSRLGQRYNNLLRNKKIRYQLYDEICDEMSDEIGRELVLYYLKVVFKINAAEKRLAQKKLLSKL